MQDGSEGGVGVSATVRPQHQLRHLLLLLLLLLPPPFSGNGDGVMDVLPLLRQCSAGRRLAAGGGEKQLTIVVAVVAVVACEAGRDDAHDVRAHASTIAALTRAISLAFSSRRILDEVAVEERPLPFPLP